MFDATITIAVDILTLSPAKYKVFVHLVNGTSWHATNPKIESEFYDVES